MTIVDEAITGDVIPTKVTVQKENLALMSFSVVGLSEDGHSCLAGLELLTK